MTESELDLIMRRVLTDCLREEYAADNLQTEQDTLQKGLNPSKKFKKQTGKMLQDPFGWYKKKSRPVWKKALRTVASFALTFFVTLGMIITVSPSARAAVVNWFLEIKDGQFLYRYHGEPINKQLPQYTIGNLPQGYVEVERLLLPEDMPVSVDIEYRNSEGKIILLSYTNMQQGTANAFQLQEGDTVKDIFIDGMPGQVYINNNPEYLNIITWVDEKQNLQFVLYHCADADGLIKMAENIVILDN